MSDAIPPPLSQGTGYGVIVGLGFAFAIGMIMVTRALKNTLNEDNHSTETFMVANRTIGTGLTAAAVISSWLYSTALLGSSLLTYRYGVAVGVWWGAAASIMVCFFSFLSIEAKRKAPNAHTLLELIRTRYGTSAHIIWIVLCVANNILVFSAMLTGASTAVTALTGMHVIASSYLMPIGVAVYTYFGGLRATFLTDYIHTCIIMLILIWFTLKVVLVKEIGSVGAFYDAVIAADLVNPVQDNYKGSHLTMTSEHSIYFGIIHILANTGVIVMDTGFWQKGFSADMASAVPGYVLGGVASFSVPWCVGTIVGLAAIALEAHPTFPTYPRLMTSQEVDEGLVLPYVAQAVAGKGGAAALLLVIFMACTSISSAQMIAMSSILSFDIYGRYFNKTPNNEQLIRWSHIGVVISSLGVSTIVLAFHYGNVNMTWLLYAFGMIVCPGVFPTTFSLVWSRQTKAAAIISPIVGMVCGLSVWFGTAYRYYGNVTIDSTGGTMPCLFGVVAAFFIPLPISVLISFVFPQKPFDFGVFRKIHKVNPDNTATGAETETQIEVEEAYFTEERLKYMKRMSRWAAFWTVSAIIGHVLLWPLPMYGARMVFSKSFFTAWVVIMFIYFWFAFIVGSIVPIFDGGWRETLKVIRGRRAAKDEPETRIETPESNDLEKSTVEMGKE